MLEATLFFLAAAMFACGTYYSFKTKQQPKINLVANHTAWCILWRNGDSMGVDTVTTSREVAIRLMADRYNELSDMAEKYNDKGFLATEFWLECGATINIDND